MRASRGASANKSARFVLSPGRCSKAHSPEFLDGCLGFARAAPACHFAPALLASEDCSRVDIGSFRNLRDIIFFACT